MNINTYYVALGCIGALILSTGGFNLFINLSLLGVL